MMTTPLPCIVCGAELRSTGMGENQPAEGIYASTPGNYGSTVWDPMNGEVLEFNVCDSCLTRAGEQGRVLVAQPKRPVVVEGLLVGWERVNRPYLSWQAGMANYDDVCQLDLDELDALPDTVELDWSPAEIRDMAR